MIDFHPHADPCYRCEATAWETIGSRTIRDKYRSVPHDIIACCFCGAMACVQAAGKPVVADSRKHRYDVWLEDGDVVYVPTSDIAKRADYIEYVWTRGIRAVGGFSSQATFNVSDTVDWIGPNP